MREVLVAAAFLAALLAGCSNEGGAPAEPGAQPELRSGKGAIAGLLVDDRFRPIHVAPGAAGGALEGFVLLQETGQRAATTANGEFSFADLDPGTYTLRVQAAGHEATPQKVQVAGDVYNEATLLARRIVSTEGIILHQEYYVFISCAIYATADCTFDQSGDSSRPGVYFAEGSLPNATAMVWEAKMNQRGLACLELYEAGTTGNNGPYYNGACTDGVSDYMQAHVIRGEVVADETGFDNQPWDPERAQQLIMFYFGDNELTCYNEAIGSSTHRCIGPAFAIKAQIIMSFFLGDEPIDYGWYCLLC